MYSHSAAICRASLKTPHGRPKPCEAFLLFGSTLLICDYAVVELAPFEFVQTATGRQRWMLSVRLPNPDRFCQARHSANPADSAGFCRGEISPSNHHAVDSGGWKPSAFTDARPTCKYRSMGIGNASNVKLLAVLNQQDLDTRGSALKDHPLPQLGRVTCSAATVATLPSEVTIKNQAVDSGEGSCSYLQVLIYL